MKKLLTLLLFLFCSHVYSQQTADAVGLTGTLKNPDGTLVNGYLQISLPQAGVQNICTTPYQVVPRGPVTYTVTNGVIVNGATANFISQDCMKPRYAYYVELYNTQNKLLFSDNWYFKQQPTVDGSRLQDIGTLVDTYFNSAPQTATASSPVGFLKKMLGVKPKAVKTAAAPVGLSGPITVAIQQAVTTNPLGNQTINQPGGTNLIINNAICTGTCTGFGGGGGGGSVTLVGLSPPSDLYTVTVGPITSSGNLTFIANTQAANTFWGGPVSGGNATPAFRTLVSNDIPNNAANTTGLAGGLSAILGIPLGGNGTATPSLGAGNSINITGSWPFQVVGINVPGGVVGNCIQLAAGNILNTVGFPCGSSGGQGSENDLSFSATPTFSNTDRVLNTITLTGNVTSSTLAAASTGGTCVGFVVVQGAGPYTFAWPSNTVGGMVIGTTNGDRNAQTFCYYSVGSLWVAENPGVINE